MNFSRLKRLTAFLAINFCSITAFAQQILETDSSNSKAAPNGGKFFAYQQTGQDELLFFEDKENLFLNSLSNFNLWNYSTRGISSNYRKITINGLCWNLQEDQRIPFDDLSVLYGNAIIESSNGLGQLLLTSGGINGSSSFNIQPSSFQKSYELDYTFGTGNTTHKLRLQYQSGLLKGKWALGFSVINNYTKEGYTPGVFLDSKTILATVKKDFSKNQTITLAAFGSIGQRTFPSSITKETAEVAQDFQYNPNWGFQSGSKRSAHQQQTMNPTILLNYKKDLSIKSTINIGASFQHRTERYSTLDWFHAYNPQPDYYQNLPSFYYLKKDELNDFMGNVLANQWENQPFQLDWDALYASNRANKFSQRTGEILPSLYVLSDEVSQYAIFRAASSFQHTFNQNIQFSGGVQFSNSKTDNFRELSDLLGGNYFVNLNQFAFKSYGQTSGWEQFDLKTPNRKIREGDKYYYNYQTNTDLTSIWSNIIFQKNRFEFWLSGAFNLTGYQRFGFYQNGIFLNDSYGKSRLQQFLTHQEKLSIQYTFGQNNKIWITGLTATNPPTFNHTFFDCRIRNTITPDLQTETIKVLEIGSTIQQKNWKASVTVFASTLKNQTDVLQFYHDDYRTYVHLLLNGINTTQTGIEFAANIRPVRFLEINLIISQLQAFYSSRPTITLLRDNDTTPILEQQTVYWKNYSAIKGPQSIVGLQFHFHLSHWGYLNISSSRQGQNYVSLNPSRYTQAAVYLLQENAEIRHSILKQEKLPSFYLVNLEAGKSIRFYKTNSKFLKKSHWLLLLGVQNLFDRKGYISYGSEELRFDYDQQNPAIFPNKYRFGLGRVFFVSLQFGSK